jgi:chemotaxis protein methyltransferase CheR
VGALVAGESSGPSLGSEQAVTFLRKLIYDGSAIVLEADKRYLLEARLGPVLARERLASFDELVARLHGDDAGPLRQRVIEAVATHETSFFRDRLPFDLFRETLIPRLVVERAASKRLNVWCAASSTGQEPYSIAFIIKEHGPALAGWSVQMIASDLSAEVLARARAGSFSQLEVDRGLPAPMLSKFFERAGAQWRVREEVRRMIDFRRINLVDAWPSMPEMDVVFLRNVLIYFDVATKVRIFERLARVMRPGGFLFLGSAESTHNLSDRFQAVVQGNTTCYQRVN